MPSITIWNRLEPRARSQDMKAGLEARVHDPLWLLARQWQVGEFEGRDTGSPVVVDVQWTSAAFDRCATGSDQARPYDVRQPLEVVVEREPVRPTSAAQDLRQAGEAGIEFFSLLDGAGLARLRPAYLTQYALTAPPGLDMDGQRMAAVFAGRVIDGIKLHTDLVHAGAALPSLPAIATADQQAVLAVTRAYLTWYDSLLSQPAKADPWSPDRMEYTFTVAAAGSTSSLTTQEYDGGSVDWYTFDRTATALAVGALQPVSATRRVVATPVTFKGMPARRFWEMEDAAVDFGALTAAAEDIGRLLLREFALIYGNDWFQIPLAVAVGAEITIQSLTVSDTFGLPTTIPHYTDVDGVMGGWRMFAVSTDPAVNAASARALVLPSNAVGPLDGAAIEDVLMLRDEAANLGWGVESVAVGASGLPLDRALVYKTSQPPVQPPAVGGPPVYRLGTDVPDYWIPLVPVKLDGGPLRLQRGRLATAPTGPVGRLLGYPGLTIFSEELPREGVHLQRRYRYARGTDGSTHVWIGRRRTPGPGEDKSRSGLSYDVVGAG